MKSNSFEKYFDNCKYILNINENYKLSFISSLNPVRSNFPSTEKINKIISDSQKKQSLIKIFFIFFLKQIIHIFTTIYSYLSNFKNVQNIVKNNLNVDFLIVSHFLQYESFHREEDKYFGKIIEHLKVNHNIFLVQNNWSKTNNKKIFKKFFSKKCHQNRLLIGKVLDIKSEIKIYFKLLKYFFLTIKKAYLINKNYKNQMLYHAVDIFNPSSVRTLRITHSIDILINQINPKYLITSFEGHAWEKLIYEAAKRNNNKIICVGYLHGGLFPDQLGVKKTKLHQFNPDIILTCGKSSYNQLIEYYANSNTKIFNIGSNRILNRSNYKKNEYFKKYSFLVLPDGSKDEFSKIILFLKSCIDYPTNLSFYVKLHPNMNINQIKNNFNFLNTPNIIFSTDLIENLSKECVFVLYRGSTAVVEAISFGLLPIFLNDLGNNNLDFIKSLNNFDRSIKGPKDLINTINKYKSSKRLNQIVKENNIFARSIYSPLKFKDLDKILSFNP